MFATVRSLFCVQVFYLQQPLVAAKDATVKGTVAMVRQASNPRLYNVKVSRDRTCFPIV